MERLVAWVILLFMSIVPARVQAGEHRAPDPAAWCGTGQDVDAEPRWARESLRQERLRAEATSTGSVRVDKGIYLVTADETVAPFDRPFDLHDSTVEFTRTSPTAFTVQKVPLNYDLDIGTLALEASHYEQHATVAYRIGSFVFPFYAQAVRDLVISSTKGIFLSPPPETNFYQYGAIDALMQRVPVIAPLLNTTSKPHSAPFQGYRIYVKETSTSLTVTWRTASPAPQDEDIQVVLSSNGNIRVSYRTVVNVAHGAVIVTSGNESWYDSKNPVASYSDPAGDVASGVPARLRDMLDVESAVIRRMSNSEILEFVFTTRGAIDPSAVQPGEVVSFMVLGVVGVTLRSTGMTTNLRGWYPVNESPATSISGRTLILRAHQSALMPGVQQNFATDYETSSFWTFADQVPFFLTVPTATAVAETDISSLTVATPISEKPIVEAFTIPRIRQSQLAAIWDRLKAAYGLTDTEVDQLAVYQSFLTDIVFWAGGVSYNSNPQVDNIAAAGTTWDYGSAHPKRVSLLHMHKTGHGWNATAEGRMHLLAHEFGHRWLYYVSIREGGADTFSLNVDRVHPDAGVHLPAAFNVVTASDSSAMGGGHFTQTGPSTYQSPPDYGSYGYSWHELYLMGLADPAEVSPWFYLRGPWLGHSGTALPNRTYNVISRTDVEPSQLTGSLGLRNPGYATSQKSFLMPFVILERAGAPVPAADAREFAADYVKRFRDHFAAATGNRGTIITSPASMPPEADFTFSPALPRPGEPVSFTDHSYGEPVSWTWTFGDGTTSTARNPVHTFTSGGTHAVMLTVSKASGSHRISKNIVVAPANVLATAGLTSVTVTWTALRGEQYEIARTSPGDAGPQVIATVGGRGQEGGLFSQGGLTAGTSYLYHVRQITNGVSAFSSDLATTVSFTDPTLTAQATAIKAAHVDELRAAVNAVRALAGLDRLGFTDSRLTAGATVVKSQHLTELRSALADARAALGLPPLVPANSCAAGTPIRAGDITELREGVR